MPTIMQLSKNYVIELSGQRDTYVHYNLISKENANTYIHVSAHYCPSVNTALACHYTTAYAFMLYTNDIKGFVTKSVKLVTP